MKFKEYEWAAIAIPEDCKSIFICQNEGLFRAKLRAGDRPLLKRTTEDGLNVFITYCPNTRLIDLDATAGIREAMQDGDLPIDPDAQ